MSADAGEGPTRERLLYLLKTRGPSTVARLARQLERTPVAVRQLLDRLHGEGLVRFEATPDGVGRPARTWSLTDAAAAHFPEGYADLAVGLLESLRSTFGPEGLERLLDARTAEQVAAYRRGLPPADAPLGERVEALARLRDDEGYMARAEPGEGGAWLLIESHCPLCAAASVCQGLCDAELRLFQASLGDDVVLARREHIVAGDTRCVYEVRPRADG